MPVAGNPLEPCPQDSLNGEHAWVAMEKPASATGDPLPGARYCFACGAMDTGPIGTRITKRDALIPQFPAGTRSYRQLNTHNPEDKTPNLDPSVETM